MATKRGDKSKFELVSYHKKEDEFIERVVLPTDTLQGIALLYNTTVADLKKLNHLHAEGDLHARRVLKVPSRGILVNLEEVVPLTHGHSTISEVSLGEEEEETNGQSYLNNVDSVVKGIREKAEIAAANSPILNGSDSLPPYRKALDPQNGELKWWKLFLPCMGILMGFPVLYFLYLQHLHHRGEGNVNVPINNHSLYHEH